MRKETSLVEMPWEEKLAFFGAKPMPPEMFRQTEANRQQSYLREKYVKGLGAITRSEMRKLYKEHPNWGLNDLLGDMLPGFSPELPPRVLLMMTELIVEEWEKTKQEEAVAMA